MSRANIRALLDVEHMHRVLGARLRSGRGFRRQRAERLVAEGLLDVADCVAVDGDGFWLEPERYCDAYGLTNAGHGALAEWRAGFADLPVWWALVERT